jgi:hypothetical protein
MLDDEGGNLGAPAQDQIAGLLQPARKIHILI